MKLRMILLLLALFLLAACGAEEPADVMSDTSPAQLEVQPTDVVLPTRTPIPPTAVPQPTALPPTAPPVVQEEEAQVSEAEPEAASEEPEPATQDAVVEPAEESNSAETEPASEQAATETETSSSTAAGQSSTNKPTFGIAPFPATTPQEAYGIRTNDHMKGAEAPDVLIIEYGDFQ